MLDSKDCSPSTEAFDKARKDIFEALNQESEAVSGPAPEHSRNRHWVNAGKLLVDLLAHTLIFATGHVEKSAARLSSSLDEAAKMSDRSATALVFWTKVLALATFALVSFTAVQVYVTYTTARVVHIEPADTRVERAR